MATNTRIILGQKKYFNGYSLNFEFLGSELEANSIEYLFSVRPDDDYNDCDHGLLKITTLS